MWLVLKTGNKSLQIWGFQVFKALSSGESQPTRMELDEVSRQLDEARMKQKEHMEKSDKSKS